MAKSTVRKIIAVGLSLLSPASISLESFADSLNLTTWYPAPYGVYSQLRSTGNSYFAYQGGSVGIGTTSPTDLLTLSKSGGTTGLTISNTASGGQSQLTMNSNASPWYLFTEDTFHSGNLILNTSINYTTNVMEITRSGNVGIGTNSPMYALDVSGNGGGPGAMRIAATNAYASGAGSFDLIIGHENNVGNTELRVWRTAERSGSMVIESNLYAQGGGNILLQPGSGNVGVGAMGPNGPAATLDVGGSAIVSGPLSYRSPRQASVGYYLCWNASSWEVTYGGSCAPSSRRFKENITSLNYGLADIDRLRPVAFNYKPEYKLGSERRIGLIAEEVDSVIPEVVNREADGKAESVRYEMLTAVLIQAVKELKEENSRLRSSLEKQRDDLENLRIDTEMLAKNRGESRPFSQRPPGGALKCRP